MSCVRSYLLRARHPATYHQPASRTHCTTAAGIASSTIIDRARPQTSDTLSTHASAVSRHMAVTRSCRPVMVARAQATHDRQHVSECTRRAHASSGSAAGKLCVSAATRHSRSDKAQHCSTHQLLRAVCPDSIHHRYAASHVWPTHGTCKYDSRTELRERHHAGLCTLCFDTDTSMSPCHQHKQCAS